MEGDTTQTSIGQTQQLLHTRRKRAISRMDAPGCALMDIRSVSVQYMQRS